MGSKLTSAYGVPARPCVWYKNALLEEERPSTRLHAAGHVPDGDDKAQAQSREAPGAGMVRAAFLEEVGVNGEGWMSQDNGGAPRWRV